jgi:antitoxin component HigA of HigAB toxin-antitoxin module
MGIVQPNPVCRICVRYAAASHKDQQDYLESLSLVIESYEQNHFPVNTGNATPIEIAESLLEENGMNSSDLGNMLGDRPLGWRILKGQRELSKAHTTAISMATLRFWPCHPS